MRNRLAVAILAMGALVGSLTLATPANAEKHGPPPQPLHQEPDGHWTPYELPKDTPSGPDTTTYTIVAGDWLSRIAEKHLGNWKLWPQIWEKNLWIKDSHWIYPGDKIVIVGAKGEGGGDGRSGAGASAGDRGGAKFDGATGGREGAEGDLESASLVGEPILIGTEDDIYCFGYLDSENEMFPRQIAGAEGLIFKVDFATDDIIFIDGGSQEGVKAGDEFFVVDHTSEIRHPKTGELLGQFVKYSGRVKVLCVQESSATAEIITSCDSVRVGSYLKPFQPIPIPIARKTPPRGRCDPSSHKTSGTIIYVKDEIESFGQDHVVLLDLGARDGIKPGDFLSVFLPSEDERIPRTMLGEIGVLSVGKDYSTAKILDSRQEFWIGVSAELK